MCMPLSQHIYMQHVNMQRSQLQFHWCSVLHSADYKAYETDDHRSGSMSFCSGRAGRTKPVESFSLLPWPDEGAAASCPASSAMVGSFSNHHY